MKTNKEPKKGSLMHAFHSSQKIAKPSADQEKNKEKNNDLSKSSKESIDEAKSAKNEQTKSVKTTERETSSSEGEEETSQPMKVTPVKKQTTKTTEKKEKQTVESKKAKKRGITKIEPGKYGQLEQFAFMVTLLWISYWILWKNLLEMKSKYSWDLKENTLQWPESSQFRTKFKQLCLPWNVSLPSMQRLIVLLGG